MEKEKREALIIFFVAIIFLCIGLTIYYCTDASACDKEYDKAKKELKIPIEDNGYENCKQGKCSLSYMGTTIPLSTCSKWKFFLIKISYCCFGLTILFILISLMWNRKFPDNYADIQMYRH